MNIDHLTKYHASLQQQRQELLAQLLRVEGAIAATAELIKTAQPAEAPPPESAPAAES